VYSEQQPLTRGTETKVFFEEVTETKVKHIRRNVRVDQASLKYFLRTDSLCHTPRHDRSWCQKRHLSC
jgi:hypothetical protein